MNKVNVLIDGYYYLYNAVYYVNARGSLENNLKQYLLMSFSNLYYQFKYCNIIICNDSKTNWRYNVYSKYKDNRTKDKNINWKLVYKIYDEFLLEIKDKFPTINIIEIEGLESDDVIYYITKYSNKKKYSNIIITSDNDYRQFLLSRKNYINLKWNYQNKSQVDIEGKDVNNTLLYVSFLLNELIQKEYILNETIIQLSNIFDKSKINIVIPEYEVFQDIVVGKTAYNIPGIIKTKSGKITSKGQYIGITGVKGLYELYKKKYRTKINFGSNDFIRNLISTIIIYKNITEISDNQYKQLERNIKRNTKLSYIDEEMIPQKYITELEELFKNML